MTEDKQVRVTVNVSHLRIGGHPFHMEEITYRQGDMLELPEDYAKHLGTSVTIHQKPQPEPTSVPNSEPEKEEEKLPDISAMNYNLALNLIAGTDNPDQLKIHLEAEKAGRSRKTVIEAIKTKLG